MFIPDPVACTPLLADGDEAAVSALAAAVDDLGLTPLHIAARNGHAEVVRLLLAAGASVDAADKYGRTPLLGSCNQWADVCTHQQYQS